MSKGTKNNAFNRAKQRALEEAAFKNHTPAAIKEKAKQDKEATERELGLYHKCSICSGMFRRKTDQVRGLVCSKCQAKQATEVGE